MNSLVEEVIRSHFEYISALKDKMQSNAITKDEIDLAKFDNKCRIGKWLEAICESFIDDGDFGNVCAAHAKFHN